MHRRGFLTAAMTGAVPLVAGCTGGDGNSGSDGGGGAGYGGGGGSGGGSSNTTESTTEPETAGETTAETETTTQQTTTATTASEATTTDGSTAAQQEYGTYDWSQLDGAEASATTTVTMRSSRFQPLVAEFSAGTEVTFVNEDMGSHTVTVPALDVDERLSGGESTTVTFDEAGVFDYVCTLHPPQMLGRVVVE